jgi:CTP-dependent riboflavin kinase
MSDFERGKIVGARLARIFVIKTVTLLGVSRATVSKVMSAYTNQGKTTSGKRNSGRKSTMTERDRRVLRRNYSKNHRITTAKVTAELNIHFEEHVPQNLTDVIFTNPTSTVQLQLLNL